MDLSLVREERTCAADINQSDATRGWDVMCVIGELHSGYTRLRKLTERKTGQSLYPEMDAVMRRIINSIEPLNVATNK